MNQDEISEKAISLLLDVLFTGFIISCYLGFLTYLKRNKDD